MNKDTQILVDAIEFLNSYQKTGMTLAMIDDLNNIDSFHITVLDDLDKFLLKHPLNKGLFRKKITAEDAIMVAKALCKGASYVCPYVEKLP